MNCKKCGSPINNGDKFCPVCGEPVEFTAEVKSPTSKSEDDTVKTDSGRTVQAITEEEPTAPEDTTVKEESAPADPADAKTEEQSGQVSYLQQALLQEQTQGQEQQQQSYVKKHKKPIIIASCAAVFLILCIFTAKTYFARDLAQIFMGENKYMQTVEGNLTSTMTDRSISVLDYASQNISSTANSHSLASKSTVSVALSDKLNKQIEQQSGDSGVSSLNKFISFINALSITSNSNCNGGKTQSYISILHKSNKLFTLNYFSGESRKQIFQIPEFSNIYLVYNTPAIKNPCDIKYDSNKLKASVSALSQVYIDKISEGKISVQKDQSLTVDGISVNAEKISVTLNEKQLTEVLKKTVQTAKNDEYLYNFISENYAIFSEIFPKYANPSDGNLPEKLDKAEYQKLCDGLISRLGGSGLPFSLTISAYVTPDNTQVARTYEITRTGTKKAPSNKTAFNIVFPKKNGLQQLAANLKIGGNELFTASLSYSSSNSGSVKILFKGQNGYNGGELKLDFSNVNNVKFFGRNTITGKFKISFLNPQGKSGSTEGAYSGIPNGAMSSFLLKSSLTVTSSISGEKLNINVTDDIKDTASIKIGTVFTEAKTSGTITVPPVDDSKAIFISTKGNENYNSQSQLELQQQYQKDVLTYLFALPSKDPDIADLIAELNSMQSRQAIR